MTNSSDNKRSPYNLGTQESPSRSQGMVENVRQPPVPYSYNIVRGFDSIFDQFKRSFDELLGPIVPFATQWPGWDENVMRQPMVDIVDQDDSFLITAELPGFTKDQVDVQVNKDMVEIRAQAQQVQNDERKNFLRRERSFRTFQRTIALPEPVNPTNVDAKLNNGILEIRIPKKEPKPEERMTRVNVK